MELHPRTSNNVVFTQTDVPDQLGYPPALTGYLRPRVFFHADKEGSELTKRLLPGRPQGQASGQPIQVITVISVA